MPKYNDPEWGEYYVDIPDAQQREILNDVLWGNGADVDAHAQMLFTEAFFNDDERAYQDLVDYLYDRYGLEFEDAFEWADFREWYEAA